MWADPDMGAILTTKGLVGGGIYSGHPALHPSGQLKLFKIDPVNFVGQLSEILSLSFHSGTRRSALSLKAAKLTCLLIAGKVAIQKLLVFLAQL